MSSKQSCKSAAAAGFSENWGGDLKGHIVWGRVERSDKSSSSDFGNSGGLAQLGTHVYHEAPSTDSSMETAHANDVPAPVDVDLPVFCPPEADDESADYVRVLVERAMRKDNFWSAGSPAHFNGTCLPCHYVHTNLGCRGALDCVYCHLPHTDARRGRSKLCMSKRLHCKRIATCLAKQMRDDPSDLDVVIPYVCARSQYTQHLLEEHIRRLRSGLPVQDDDDGSVDLADVADQVATAAAPSSPAIAPPTQGPQGNISVQRLRKIESL